MGHILISCVHVGGHILIYRLYQLSFLCNKLAILHGALRVKTEKENSYIISRAPDKQRICVNTQLNN